MRVKILDGCTQSDINEAANKLEKRGYIIIDIIYYPQTAKHYKTYACIKFKEIT